MSGLGTRSEELLVKYREERLVWLRRTLSRAADSREPLRFNAARRSANPSLIPPPLTPSDLDTSVKLGHLASSQALYAVPAVRAAKAVAVARSAAEAAVEEIASGTLPRDLCSACAGATVKLAAIEAATAASASLAAIAGVDCSTDMRELTAVETTLVKVRQRRIREVMDVFMTSDEISPKSDLCSAAGPHTDEALNPPPVFTAETVMSIATETAAPSQVKGGSERGEKNEESLERLGAQRGHELFYNSLTAHSVLPFCSGGCKSLESAVGLDVLGMLNLLRCRLHVVSWSRALWQHSVT